MPLNIPLTSNSSLYCSLSLPNYIYPKHIQDTACLYAQFAGENKTFTNTVTSATHIRGNFISLYCTTRYPTQKKHLGCNTKSKLYHSKCMYMMSKHDSYEPMLI